MEREIWLLTLVMFAFTTVLPNNTLILVLRFDASFLYLILVSWIMHTLSLFQIKPSLNTSLAPIKPATLQAFSISVGYRQGSSRYHRRVMKISLKQVCFWKNQWTYLLRGNYNSARVHETSHQSSLPLRESSRESEKHTGWSSPLLRLAGWPRAPVRSSLPVSSNSPNATSHLVQSSSPRDPDDARHRRRAPTLTTARIWEPPAALPLMVPGGGRRRC